MADAGESMTGEPGGFERLLTPSKITAWLDCAHYLTLKHEVEGGGRPKPGQPFGSFAKLLMDKGLEHEAAVLARYEAEGLRVLRVGDKGRGESFAAWAQRSLPALGSDADVIFQMPFVHDGIRGVADFLERHVDDDGTVRWEPVDAKLARNAAKPGHVLQLCFYAEAIGALTGVTPRNLKVSLGSGSSETVRFEDVRPYWERLRGQLRYVLAVEPSDAVSRPEPCDHCQFCEFAETCETTWRDADALVYVAGIRSAERTTLETAAVDSLAALAARTEPVLDLRPDRLARLQVQADLQVQAREQPEGTKPPFVIVEQGDDPVWGHGFEQLPAPDSADIFLDFEGHPFWRADRGLFFLFGYIAEDDSGTWGFYQLWAHDEAEEAARVEELIEYIAERRAAQPGMHVYHYNHTERSSLEALTAEHAVAEGALARLVADGVFVDLFLAARNALQVGTEGYGLKYLERLTDYERSHEIDKGAGAVVAFEEYGSTRDQALLDAIAAYNEDDVQATKALRDWLVDHRPAHLEWRADPEDEDKYADVDALTEQLGAFDEGTPQRQLADLLGYWIREWQAYIAPIVGKLTNEATDHLEDRTVLTGLGNPEEVDRFTPTGRPAKWPGLRLAFPPQPLDRGFRDARPGRSHKVIYLSSEGLVTFAAIDSIDVENGTLVLVWDERAQEHGSIPGSVVLDDWVGPTSKLDALNRLVHQALDPDVHGLQNPVTLALLQGDPPAFCSGGGPADSRFSDDKDELARWVTELEGSVLAVQGPPGTGKTYRGAHMAKELVTAGKRVGIMAMSHNAIDNFLAEIVKVFAENPAVELRAARNRAEPEGGGLAGVSYVSSNKALANLKYNVVCGTAWTFASKDLLGEPVDVLLIDEAGQLALIDAVVASMAARSVVLLGDPLQLPQVAKASHPGSSGHSALGHVLGDRDTVEDTFGVFITETRRMHPDVCEFISDRIYEGRLTSYVDCANQDTELGTGLRWLQVDHTRCSTESVEEAVAVATQIRELLGRNWTDKHGEEHVIGVDDVMVVAPYNDQVRLLREHLHADPHTRGVSVGTVDKFQGRQAPVVLFTMTSSSADDMPRGTEFLFSKNRLNVAISRAQCLAYLVCTEQLLNSRAKTVEDMYLIATLCAFVEYANR
jgi:predicted RecB family nuclease